jgi:hypothetical protein
MVGTKFHEGIVHNSWLPKPYSLPPLQDILLSEQIKLDEDFKRSLIMDIVKVTGRLVV